MSGPHISTRGRSGDAGPRCRSLCGSAAVTALSLLTLGLVGCINDDTRNQMKASESVLAPLFSQTSPVDAAKWAADPYDPDKRARGLLLLANAPFGGADAYLDMYRLRLNDVSPNVRAVAAQALGMHGQPEDVPRLLPLMKDRQWRVRLDAACALQRLHNPVAIPVLLEAIRIDREAEEQVRTEAAAALGQYADPRVVEGLIAALDDDSLAVSYAALTSLRTLTGNDALADDRKLWKRWLDTTPEPFAGRQQYVYPVFHRDKRWIDYIPFMPEVPNEIPAAPAGMPVQEGVGG